MSVGCTGLKPEWKTKMETTTQFPVVPGTVVEVTCSDAEAIIQGNKKVTCKSETQFTFLREPSCSGTGKIKTDHTGKGRGGATCGLVARAIYRLIL